ncbi:hypothetical protein [Nannocystis pusilla]|uniref:Uncharacterized protein n=1 Tax=Nannocystis pusilla TaxID=889268 RepID=A0ABS7TR45_9BACT|nr:hypothetical protein [Nannocystis pusilla]MBZ5710521.1 hypothetical protein [Nannocystis pusilla]
MFSLGMTPASLFFVAFTITMTFIVVSFRCGVPDAGGLFTQASKDVRRNRHGPEKNLRGPGRTMKDE